MTTDNRFAAATLACPAAQTARTRTRFMILALISGGTMINYLDRSVMGIAGPECSFTTGFVFDLSGGRATY
jgi:ACS family D-galactonate transporter-like MFS transporter